MPKIDSAGFRLLKRAFIFAIGVCAFFSSVATADERPNILFIFSDDHAPHAIGAYDGRLKSVDPTPNIDALARQGMLFRNSFCTNSMVAAGVASRSALLEPADDQ